MSRSLGIQVLLGTEFVNEICFTQLAQLYSNELNVIQYVLKNTFKDIILRRGLLRFILMGTRGTVAAHSFKLLQIPSFIRF